MTTWWCTWCGNSHTPDSAPVQPLPGSADPGHYAQPDERYALAMCSGGRRVLVTDRAEAEQASRELGRYRRKPLKEPMKADPKTRMVGPEGTP